MREAAGGLRVRTVRISTDVDIRNVKKDLLVHGYAAAPRYNSML